MDIPTEWLSSQVVLGAVLVVLAVVGVVFDFRVGARQAPGPGADDTHEDAGHDTPATSRGGSAGPTGPGTYGPIAPVAPASVFETEPCWVGLLPGRSRASADAPAEDASRRLRRRRVSRAAT